MSMQVLFLHPANAVLFAFFFSLHLQIQHAN